MKKGGAVDGNALRTQRTVERILAESLRLFNEQGEANVATGAIATALEMSPGNLYYHFRNKDEIVAALFRRFEARIDVDPQPSGDAAQAIEDLWLYLHLMLEAIWDYRFLYRNLDDVLARNRRLRDVFNRILDHKLAAMETLCNDLVATGAMLATPEEIHTIARNALVVATYWLNYCSVSARRGKGGEDNLGRGAYQVLALFAPYLVGEARAHLAALGQRYID